MIGETIQKMEILHTKQASDEVKYYAVHAVVFLGYEESEVAKIFNSGVSTIYRWVKKWRETGTLERKEIEKPLKYTEIHRNWVYKLVDLNPLLFLHQICYFFKKTFDETLPVSSAWRILNEGGYTHKVIERRAKQVHFCKIVLNFINCKCS